MEFGAVITLFILLVIRFNNVCAHEMELSLKPGKMYLPFYLNIPASIKLQCVSGKF